jgi:hypothetical protein
LLTQKCSASQAGAATTAGVTSLCVCVARLRRSGIGKMTARALRLKRRARSLEVKQSLPAETGTGEGARPHPTAAPHSGYDRPTDTPPACVARTQHPKRVRASDDGRRAMHGRAESRLVDLHGTSDKIVARAIQME